VSDGIPSIDDKLKLQVDALTHNASTGSEIMSDRWDKVKKAGPIAFADTRGYFSGCTVVPFTDEKDMNRWFENNLGFMLVNVVTMATPEGTTLLGIVSPIHTPEEITEMQEIQAEVQAALEKRRAQREKDRQEREKAEKAAEIEEKRLAGVGRACEQNHGAVIEENRKLREEVAKLRKKVKRAED